MNKYICEFIGTFFLVLTVGSTVIDGGEGVIPPLAIGSVLMVMIFATGHISGGHLNPAVTLAVWMRGKCDTADVPGYIVGQIAGGVAAAFLVLFMKGNPTVTAMQFGNPVVPLIAEFLGAFAIAFVVLNVATSRANHNNYSTAWRSASPSLHSHLPWAVIPAAHLTPQSPSGLPRWVW
jgi:aquaporin Z